MNSVFTTNIAPFLILTGSIVIILPFPLREHSLALAIIGAFLLAISQRPYHKIIIPLSYITATSIAFHFNLRLPESWPSVLRLVATLTIWTVVISSLAGVAIKHVAKRVQSSRFQ